MRVNVSKHRDLIRGDSLSFKVADLLHDSYTDELLYNYYHLDTAETEFMYYLAPVQNLEDVVNLDLKNYR